jgi:hypothetical protein
MDLGLGASRQEVEIVDDQIEVNESLDLVVADSVSSVVHDALDLGLDFSPVREFQDDQKGIHVFGSPHEGLSAFHHGSLFWTSLVPTVGI